MKYQIIYRERAMRGEERNAWHFYAHGARYNKEEAADVIGVGLRRGLEIKTIRV